MKEEGWSEVNGIRYHYQHIKEEDIPRGDKVFIVKTIIEFVNRPIHLNTYYVPQDKLDRFFYDLSQTGEQVVDIKVREDGRGEG